MSEDRKKPGVAFWATVVLLVLLVGYPLSAGPFMWLYSREYVPDWADAPVACIYAPLS